MQSGIDFWKLKFNGFLYNVAKTILSWFVCVYAVTMTGFGGIFVTFSASSSYIWIWESRIVMIHKNLHLFELKKIQRIWNSNSDFVSKTLFSMEGNVLAESLRVSVWCFKLRNVNVSLTHCMLGNFFKYIFLSKNYPACNELRKH